MAKLLGDSEVRVWRGFLRTHARLVGRLDEELREAHGLPLTHYDVLTNLDAAPEGRLRMRELADAVLLSRSGLTRLVDRLEREGLVEREECAEDARGAFAVLTEPGRRVLLEARPTHHDGVRRLFLSALEPGEADRLSEVWDQIKT